MFCPSSSLHEIPSSASLLPTSIAKPKPTNHWNTLALIVFRHKCTLTQTCWYGATQNATTSRREWTHSTGRTKLIADVFIVSKKGMIPTTKQETKMIVSDEIYVLWLFVMNRLWTLDVIRNPTRRPFCAFNGIRQRERVKNGQKNVHHSRSKHKGLRYFIQSYLNRATACPTIIVYFFLVIVVPDKNILQTILRFIQILWWSFL